jgi:hypothetical protein
MGGGGFGMVSRTWTKPLLEALDTNKDGKVTKDELVAGVKRFFEDCDKDKTGKLTEDQIAEGLTRLIPQPQRFGRSDGGPGSNPTNPPGGEPGRGAGGRGGPGADGRAGPGADGRGGPGGGGRLGGGFGNGLGRMVAGVIVLRADTDKDGKVTLAELTAAAEALFKELDKDQKGTLDEKALEAGIGLILPPPNFGQPSRDRPRMSNEPKKD